MQSFKFELKPDGEQLRDMRKFSGSCRFVFNKALAIQKENYEAGNKFIGYGAMAKQLTNCETVQKHFGLKKPLAIACNIR